MQAVGFVSGRSLGSDGFLVEGFRRGLQETVSPKDKILPSNSAGPTANSIGCRRWQPS